MMKLTKIILKYLEIIKNIVLRFKLDYIDLFEKLIKDCETVLDLGCGSNSPLGKIKKRKNHTLGVDLFEEYIKISKQKKIHDEYLILDILDIDKKISPKSFDCVILMGVIEHLEKLDGIKIIKKMEKIARKKIIISTPNGYVHQDEYDDNDFQIHKSGWNMNMLKRLGFQIYGISGLKYIRCELGDIKYKPERFWNIILLFSYKFVRYFPQFAFELLCVKEL